MDLPSAELVSAGARLISYHIKKMQIFCFFPSIPIAYWVLCIPREAANLDVAVLGSHSISSHTPRIRTGVMGEIFPLEQFRDADRTISQFRLSELRPNHQTRDLPLALVWIHQSLKSSIQELSPQLTQMIASRISMGILRAICILHLGRMNHGGNQ